MHVKTVSFKNFRAFHLSEKSAFLLEVSYRLYEPVFAEKKYQDAVIYLILVLKFDV